MVMLLRKIKHKINSYVFIYWQNVICLLHIYQTWCICSNIFYTQILKYRASLLGPVWFDGLALISPFIKPSPPFGFRSPVPE